MKYPYFSIITIFFLILGMQSLQAQSCSEVDNLNFQEITNNSIEMYWDPHPTAISLELEYFLDGSSVGVYSLPGTAVTHTYYDNTGLLANAQSVSVTIRAECSANLNWSEFTVANTETDIYNIDHLRGRCSEFPIKKGSFLVRSRNWKLDLECYCSTLENFASELDVNSEIPEHLKAAFEWSLQACIIAELPDPNFPDKRNFSSGKWDNEVPLNRVKGAVTINGNHLLIKNQNGIENVFVYDILGKLVSEKRNIGSNQTAVRLQEGLYIFNIIFTDGSSISNKLVIK